jgi:hypothetical protein
MREAIRSWSYEFFKSGFFAGHPNVAGNRNGTRPAAAQGIDVFLKGPHWQVEESGPGTRQANRPDCSCGYLARKISAIDCGARRVRAKLSSGGSSKGSPHDAPEVDAMRVGHLDRKGKVESRVGHAQKTPLKGRRFESPARRVQVQWDTWQVRLLDMQTGGD